MKSSNQEIRMFKQLTSKKIQYSDLFKNNTNNNRKEILQEMNTSTQFVTSISQKNIVCSFKEKCLQNPSSILTVKPPGTQCLKQFPKINNSYCHPRLLQLLEFYNVKPKEERLLKGQNQLILERKQFKYFAETKEPKRKIPLIQIKTKEMNHKRANNTHDIGKEDSESLLDSDRMELIFDIEDSKDVYNIENNDDFSISPSKKYDKIALPLSRATILGYQNRQQLLSTNFFNSNKNNSNINNSSTKSNIVSQAKNIIKAYDDDSNVNNISNEKVEPTKSMKHNKSYINFITSIPSSAHTVNTSHCLPLMKQFNHSSSQTNLFLNKSRKLKTIRKTISKHKAKCNTIIDFHNKKMDKKKKYGSLLSSNSPSINPYGLGIIFHSSNKFSYVIQLNKLNEWKFHEEVWDKITQNKDITEDYEQYLLPPNMKDTILSSFYYYKKKKSHKTSLDNCFIYCLDHLHVKDFKHESMKWKDALRRIVDRWQPDQVDSLFFSKTMNEELMLKIKREAPIIVDYAQGLYKNIINLLVKIFRYKLKKKLD